MEFLYILNTLVLGIMLWDIHRGTKEIIAIAKAITQRTEDLHTKTDEVLQRLPRSN